MSITIAHSRARHRALAVLLPIAAGLLSLVALFWPECRAAVGVWLASTAYGHCFLVVPIAAYLAWDRRETLHGLSPRPAPSLVLLGLPLSFVWFAAERLGIMEGRQLVVIAFVEVLFLTVLGWRLFKALMGPLLYLVFLVPFGAFLTPLLQAFTAHFIDIGLTILGIPHFVNAMIIEISAGTFYVAEACAGLRFLIASIAFGVFFALLNYRTPGRRAAFIAASVLIPIVANGLRALGIVVLGNVLGSAEAAAADHIIYGWIFFSFVMLLLVAAGLPFRQLPDKHPLSRLSAPILPGKSWAALLLVVIAAAGPATAAVFDRWAEPARLAGRPVLATPPDCSLVAPELGTASSDRVTIGMSCADRVWTVTLQVLPARSTASAVSEARRRLIGPLDPEEVVTGPLPNAPGWQTLVSHDPSQVTAIATWVDGSPAAGGLAQRLLQARDSILGSQHMPLVMAVTTRSGRILSETESRLMLSDVARLLTAQPDLDGEIARLTQVQ